MDDLNRPIVRTFRRATTDDFQSCWNNLRNSGKIKELGIIPLTNYSATTIITNTLSEMYKKKVPKSYYGEINFDFNWELKLGNDERII